MLAAGALAGFLAPMSANCTPAICSPTSSGVVALIPCFLTLPTYELPPPESEILLIWNASFSITGLVP